MRCKEKNIPRRRFKEFENGGEWEERKLGEITNSYSGGTPSVTNKLFYGGSIPFIRSGEINSEKTELFITDEGLKSSSAKMVETGDILYALYGATSGEVSLSRISGAINQAILAIKPLDKYNSTFIMQWLRREKENIIGSYLQGGQGNLSGNIVKELVISIPDNETEQYQIGKLFSNIDNLITLHQRKLDKLKVLKKSYLAQMFPSVGESKPRLRFSGFNDDWEQRKLGDMCDEFKSGSSILAKDICELGAYPVYGGNGLRGYTATYNHDGIYALIGRQGALCGNMNKVYGKAYFTEHAVAVKANKNNNTDFLFYLLDKMNLRQYSGQSAQPGLAVNKLIELITLAPNWSEQKQISIFFTKLDNLITLHQRKLEKLQNIKKAYLNEMFV